MHEKLNPASSTTEQQRRGHVSNVPKGLEFEEGDEVQVVAYVDDQYVGQAGTVFDSVENTDGSFDFVVELQNGETRSFETLELLSI